MTVTWMESTDICSSPLEVRPGQGQLMLREENGVIADAVQLDLDLSLGMGDGVMGGADDLR